MIQRRQKVNCEIKNMFYHLYCSTDRYQAYRYGYRTLQLSSVQVPHLTIISVQVRFRTLQLSAYRYRISSVQGTAPCNYPAYWYYRTLQCSTQATGRMQQTSGSIVLYASPLYAAWNSRAAAADRNFTSTMYWLGDPSWMTRMYSRSPWQGAVNCSRSGVLCLAGTPKMTIISVSGNGNGVAGDEDDSCWSLGAAGPGVSLK